MALLSHLTSTPLPYTRIPVGLGDRSYDILIGADVLDHAHDALKALGENLRVVLITDSNVAALHGGKVRARFEAFGFHVTSITVDAGESAKSWENLMHICDQILAAKIERRDLVVALGGGVIGDLVGFAASIIRRGMRFVQMPTTLLAQVDSSVGGKTAVNSQYGKNLIGSFYQPSLVLADTKMLDTLPEREFRAGYAEMIKYGLINDRAFFDWCETHWRSIFQGGAEREQAIASSCRAKAAVVSRDEQERGERALLNLGHTFAHALEQVTGYDNQRLIHGEAVSIGLALAYRFSADRELCSWDEALRVSEHLIRVGLPTTLQDVVGGVGSIDALVEAMFQDKKVVRGELTFILSHGIGESFIAHGIPAEDVKEFLTQEIERVD